MSQEKEISVSQPAAAPIEEPSVNDTITFNGDSLTLSGAQLLEALDFIAPDRDAGQLESEVTIQYGEGHTGKGMYCWCTEYPEEGAIFIDGSTAVPAAPAPSPADEWAAFKAALDKRAKSAGFEVGRMTECELDNAWWGWQAGRAASANETGAEGEIVVPIELSSVAETLAEGGGFWRSCSGCHETNEGHETGHYPYSKILKCHLGGGCSECGGIGAVWDDTDYEAMGRDFEQSLGAPSRSPAMAAEAVAIPAGCALVPIEPTPQMRKAAADAWLDCGSKLILNKAAAAARAAIAAAPSSKGGS
ncbi:hypothetical protein QZM42_33555 [Burkholderia vietnamiensis]|uniref:hypothetical protein n=1 Tax=Burkholderia vietnamiensis TaxID=60552 RepID=UPI00264D08EF|nr:hypothetical protein [Burkholderia vietnamiensis]MDN7413454.1 hypothetical protein [Burkholderia vietnamiensis]